MKSKRPKCKACDGHGTKEVHDKVTGEYTYVPCDVCGGSTRMSHAQYSQQYTQPVAIVFDSSLLEG